MTDLRYPIGKFKYDGPPTPEQRQEFLHQIEQTPANLRAAIKGLSQAQLDTAYRPEGWTVAPSRAPRPRQPSQRLRPH